MTKVTYNKLVRDKIPAIIEKNGKKAVWERLPDDEYIRLLNAEFLREVNNYVENESPETLADIGEVMHAILAFKGITVAEFQEMRLKNLEERGGFTDRVFLKEVVEGIDPL